jgi:hypothetical protein
MKVVIQAGKYYLGDPCYSLNESWDDILKQSKNFKEPLIDVPEGQILAFKTAYGDGEYPSNAGRKFCVDSGLLGLVPVSLAEKELQGRQVFNSMIVDFREPALCKKVKGKLYFGRVVIDTN